MDCEHAKIHILSPLREGLSPDECKEILHHMEGCTQCRKEAEELEKTWRLMDQWKIEGPSAFVKSSLMAVAQEELQSVQGSWWASFRRFLIFQTVVGALGFSMIIYLLFPYDKIINLCEINILNGGLMAFFPKSLIYFVIGLLYGLVPISLSGICFSKNGEDNPLTKGLGGGFIFAAFLVPFFLVQCPEFSSGLILTVALGMIAGSLSGGTGTLWVLSMLGKEASR